MTLYTIVLILDIFRKTPIYIDYIVLWCAIALSVVDSTVVNISDVIVVGLHGNHLLAPNYHSSFTIY